MPGLGHPGVGQECQEVHAHTEKGRDFFTEASKDRPDQHPLYDHNTETISGE